MVGAVVFFIMTVLLTGHSPVLVRKQGGAVSKEDQGEEDFRELQMQRVLLHGDAGRAVGGKGDAFGFGRSVDAGRHGLLAAVEEHLDAVAVQKDAETERIALAVHGTAAKVYDILMEPCLAPVKDEPSGARLIGKGG